MEKKKVFLFVFDGFSDWEAAYALPEIHKSGKYEIATIALSKRPVKSAGGLTVVPDFTLYNIISDDIALLILPGGQAWEDKKMTEIAPFIKYYIKKGIPVAAICGATLLLAENGILDGIQHTSNYREYLNMCFPAYCGQNNYVEDNAVTHENVITASGSGAIDFAKEIFKKLSILDNYEIGAWYRMFKNGLVLV